MPLQLSFPEDGDQEKGWRRGAGVQGQQHTQANDGLCSCGLSTAGAAGQGVGLSGPSTLLTERLDKCNLSPNNPSPDTAVWIENLYDGKIALFSLF